MMTDRGIGASVPRKEDQAMLVGAAAYTDDLSAPGELHGVFVRADIPHGRIVDIDTGGADAAVLVLTAADLDDHLLRPIPSFVDTPPFDLKGRDGEFAYDASQFPLAKDRVRYLGEPVALVVADTLAAARDAAEQVVVDYEELPALTEIDQALADDATAIWPGAGGNLSIDYESGDGNAVARAFEAAAQVVDCKIVNNRVVVHFMEPRAILADYDKDADLLDLQLGCQAAHGIKALVEHVIDLGETAVRVRVPMMGGGFGSRGPLYPEFAAVAIAALKLARPVKWAASRAESFLSDNQARDHVMRGRLALDGEGRFTALRVDTYWRHGAYLTGRSVWVMIHYLIPMLTGGYRIPHYHLRLRGVFTNTTPHAAYRGVGRMEANYMIERLVDAAARQSGIDRVELRRRNLVGGDEMPWASATGATITSGAFAEIMDRALELADWAGFADRRAASEAAGLRRGIGLGMYVENDGSTPTEFAEIEAHADGRVTVYAGTQDFGMGHSTIYAQIVAQELGIDFDMIDLVDGDTDRVTRGSGTHGSRSARMGGGAVVYSARRMVENGKERAGELLEAAPADLEFADGRYRIAGTDRSVTLADVAAGFEEAGEKLSGEHDFEVSAEAHANGCQICELTVDPETGAVKIERYTAVADTGTAINPMIVHGQLHGGAAQGIGQAAFERVVYDRESGQTLTGSLMDYHLPRAGDFPSFDVELKPIVEADNPLGVKGVGESSATGAPAAVMNALRDALGTDVDMPAAPENVWRALRRDE